jgi:uncharacterized protein (TIGR02246 family)
MKGWYRSVELVLTAFLLACVGCEPRQDEGVPPELRAAIDAFYAAVEAGDGEARIGIFSDDAIMMPNHWTLWEGKDAIAEVIRAGEGSVFRLRDRELVDIDASGNLAYTVNSYYYTYHPEGGEPQWHKTKNVHIWKRDAAGNWQLHVDIWNSDVTMDEFPNE